jgi:hypothetical protein
MARHVSDALVRATAVFWVLERRGLFIGPTGGDWGPSHLPTDDPRRALRFDSPGEARRWADGPGQGWTDFAPVRLREQVEIRRFP